MTIEPGELYCVDDIAAHLHVSRLTVRDWLARKEMKGAKFSKKWSVRGKDLLAFIDARIEGKPPGDCRATFELRKRLEGRKR